MPSSGATGIIAPAASRPAEPAPAEGPSVGRRPSRSSSASTALRRGTDRGQRADGDRDRRRCRRRPPRCRRGRSGGRMLDEQRADADRRRRGQQAERAQSQGSEPVARSAARRAPVATVASAAASGSSRTVSRRGHAVPGRRPVRRRRTRRVERRIRSGGPVGTAGTQSAARPPTPSASPIAARRRGIDHGRADEGSTRSSTSAPIAGATSSVAAAARNAASVQPSASEAA